SLALFLRAARIGDVAEDGDGAGPVLHRIAGDAQPAVAALQGQFLAPAVEERVAEDVADLGSARQQLADRPPHHLRGGPSQDPFEARIRLEDLAVAVEERDPVRDGLEDRTEML